MLRKADGLVLRKVGLVVWQVDHRRPSLLVGRAQHLEDTHELVVVRRPWEERPRRRHLAEYAADAPQVDRCRVLARAHEHVGRAVPQRHHLVCVAPHRDAEGPREAEVGKLQLSLLVDEEVLRLQVAVEHAPLVAKLDAAQQLVERRLDHAGLEPVLRVQKLLQVLVQVLEDERQLLLRVDHVVQPDNVWVLQLLQDGDLANGSTRNALILCF
mmetsp:Transcript_19614/g.42331  ORF Transcript_19614/g.42331 Transcript_19614/m.42331 type:complete len:213 (-) Transcript_19614:268-906(-)